MTGMQVRVALAQFAPGPLQEANIAALADLAAQAHREGAQVLVAPEYSQAFIPGGGPAWAAVADDITGSFVQALAALSTTHDGMVIIAGMLVSVPGGPPRNTVVAVGPQGVLATAEKLHLYDAFGARESDSVSAGDIGTPEILDIGGLRWGFLACYDLRFPEVMRRLVDAGADCVAVPAQWVPGEHKVEHWLTLLRARAIENQCFVVGVGHPAPHGIGHSVAIDPLGVVVGQQAEGTGLCVVTLESNRPGVVRAANPMAMARRFDVTPRTS